MPRFTHLDGNPRNNAPSNLVICQDKAYHMLLHARQRERAFPRSPDAPSSYILRDLDEGLWREAKSKAALAGQSLKDVITDLVAAWVKAK